MAMTLTRASRQGPYPIANYETGVNQLIDVITLDNSYVAGGYDVYDYSAIVGRRIISADVVVRDATTKEVVYFGELVEDTTGPAPYFDKLKVLKVDTATGLLTEEAAATDLSAYEAVITITALTV